MQQTKIELTRKALRDLGKVPEHIETKLLLWVDAVEKFGIYKVRENPGYHDEPLKGERRGQRSIRLSKSYRAIYTMNKNKEMEIISVEEVNKHEY